MGNGSFDIFDNEEKIQDTGWNRNVRYDNKTLQNNDGRSWSSKGC